MRRLSDDVIQHRIDRKSSVLLDFAGHVVRRKGVRYSVQAGLEGVVAILPLVPNIELLRGRNVLDA